MVESHSFDFAMNHTQFRAHYHALTEEDSRVGEFAESIDTRFYGEDEDIA
jgi:hypothetical protein